jgi:hypothetical protein
MERKEGLGRAPLQRLICAGYACSPYRQVPLCFKAHGVPLIAQIPIGEPRAVNFTDRAIASSPCRAPAGPVTPTGGCV